MTVFSLESGTVVLGGRRVLEDVTVQVDEGEFVAVLGANGSGKTTLVRTLVGLNPLASGSLTVFGTPVARFREWPRIGYVPQRLSVGGGVLYNNLGVMAQYNPGVLGFETRIYDPAFPTVDAYGNLNLAHGFTLFGGERDILHSGRRTVFGLQLQF